MNDGPLDRGSGYAGDPFSGLCEVLQATRPDADLPLIRRAYDVAAYWHHGQLRRSGDPFITHPLAVATILAELGADDETLCAAMLHDTIEDTDCTVAELNRQFGAGIAAMANGIGMLSHVRGRRKRRTAKAMAATRWVGDTRLLEVTLAHRLHNMRILQFVPQARQLRTAREVLEVFVPVVQQLGWDVTSSELETLAAATLKRNRHVRTVSGRLLAAMTALLPAGARGRWREEWLGELHTMPARRDRARFAAHTLLAVPRLALTLRRPVAISGRAR